jgi:single-strand DNA-binding protein
MAKPSVNRITLVGELQGPVEIRNTGGGDKVASFVVVTRRSWQSRGRDHEKAEWHKCVAWNPKHGYKLADVVERWGRQGCTVYVEGRVEYRTFDNRTGDTKYLTEIVCTEFKVMDGAGPTDVEDAVTAHYGDSNGR